MFENHNFYTFILLLLFAVLLLVFNSFISHHYYVDLISWILAALPLAGLWYVWQFQDANTKPFYIFFSALLVLYVIVFAGTKIYEVFAV